MMRRTPIILAGGAIVLAAGAFAIFGLAPASPPAALSETTAATAEVTRGNLRDTKTVAGTLSYGALSALRPSIASGSGMVTWIAPVGSTVERGEPLFTIDGQPTILFYGSVPQHRTLRFDPASASPVWVELATAETAVESAVLRLSLEQERLKDAEARAADASARLEDAVSDRPVMAEFIELAGAVLAAEAKLGRVTELSAAELAPSVDVAAAEAGLATARAAFYAAIRSLRRDLSVARLDAVTAHVAVAEATVTFDQLRSALDALLARVSDKAEVTQIAGNLTALGYTGPLSEQVRDWQRAAGLAVTGIVGPAQLVIAEGPVHVATHSASIGETLVASSPERGSILDYSSTERLVTVPLGIGDQRLAAVGRAVIVTLPDDTEVEGTIAEVGSVVTDGTITVTVAIADQAALSGLEVAAVEVEFVSDSRDDVLSVPVAALLARPEGGFAVEVVTGGSRVLVPVTTGLFAAGRVEVRGEGIAEGTEVGIPR
jgi:hypothetical protein